MIGGAGAARLLAASEVIGAFVAPGGMGRGGLSLGTIRKFQRTIRNRQLVMTTIDFRSMLVG